LLQGIKTVAFVVLWSMMVKMESKPSDTGRSVIRSMATVSNGVALVAGVIGKGGAFGCTVFTLLLWQVAQPLT
jgi:hypothetical protein